jgi:hypothetical protein
MDAMTAGEHTAARTEAERLPAAMGPRALYEVHGYQSSTDQDSGAAQITLRAKQPAASSQGG